MRQLLVSTIKQTNSSRKWSASTSRTALYSPSHTGTFHSSPLFSTLSLYATINQCANKGHYSSLSFYSTSIRNYRHRKSVTHILTNMPSSSLYLLHLILYQTSHDHRLGPHHRVGQRRDVRVRSALWPAGQRRRQFPISVGQTPKKPRRWWNRILWYFDVLFDVVLCHLMPCYIMLC